MTSVKRKTCKLVRKSIKKNLPPPMMNYFQPLSHSKNTRNNKKSIILPRVRTVKAQSGFYYQGASIYNSLPRELRSEENDETFTRKLGTHIF